MSRARYTVADYILSVGRSLSQLVAILYIGIAGDRPYTISWVVGYSERSGDPAR